MLLRRGHILLMAGGAIIVSSFGVLAYYAVNFLAGIQNENKSILQPDDSLVVRKYIEKESLQGIVVVTAQELGYELNVAVSSPANKTIITPQNVPLPFVGRFSVEETGDYTLIVVNPLANNQTLNASASLVVTANFTDPTIAVVFVAGIVVAIAGLALTILDRQRRKKMKRFGDTSDLV